MLALGSTLAAAGCAGATGAGTAAVVDGRVITEKDAQTAAREINSGLQLQQPVTTSVVVSLLIRAPYVIEAAAQRGNPVTTSVARAQIPRVNDPAESTIQLLRADAATQGLDDAAKLELSSRFRELEVTVNPRYGRFNPDTALVELQRPNWLGRARG